jgi:hypothetical protein
MSEAKVPYTIPTWPKRAVPGARETLNKLAVILGPVVPGAFDGSDTAIIRNALELVRERDALRERLRVLLEEIDGETDDGR